MGVVRPSLAAVFLGILVSVAVSDEPKAAVAVAIDVIVAQPVAVVVEAAEVTAEDKEAVAKKKVPAAVTFENLVAPLAKALEGNIDLNAADAQVQQWIPQFLEQYKPMLWTELNFVRQTCELSPEQRRKVKVAGDAALTDAARQMAELQGRRVAGRAAQQPEPRKIIRAALKQALQEVLSPEAMQAFDIEFKLRAERRKEASILCAVSRLDSVLCLTSEQRAAIEASIGSAWKDQWESWLMLAMYGDQYFPTVPDAQVVQHLNGEQKAIWNGLQKIEFGYWGGGAAQEDDGWWGQPAEQAAQPAAVIRVAIPAE